MAGQPRTSPASFETQPPVPSPLVILGIDPGLRVTGWGIVSADGDAMRSLASGAISLRGDRRPEERLHHIYKELGAVIAQWTPAEVAVEDPFVGENARSAFAIGEARAAALLAAAEAGLRVRPYAPAEVKIAVTGYGRSDKAQVQELVRVQLGLEKAPRPADAADALAVAICHHLRLRIEARLG
jgi:crossover junction endodeoxyribonuclease RuvC